MAPSAKNRQPWKYIVFGNKQKQELLDCMEHEERIMEICDTLSIGASIENILLRAEELGLGTLWIANTCFAYDEMVAYLSTDKQLVGAIAVGYANENPHPRPRKSLEEIVEMRI